MSKPDGSAADSGRHVTVSGHARDTRNPYGQVPAGGYAWWYIDALSDDGREALSAILFVGAVFSPARAARRRRGERPPAEEHVAVNLALYRDGRPRAWVMSEYGIGALGGIGDGGPRIGASALERLPSGTLRLRVRERSAPFLAALAGVGQRVVGTIELEPLAPPLPLCALDGPPPRHTWQVMMPRARVRVRFERPAVSFDGIGYHDINAGSVALDEGFSSWSWARFHDGRRTTVLYALSERGGGSRALVADVREGEPVRAPAAATLLPEGELRPARWGLWVPSWFAVEPGGGGTLRCHVGALWDESPFYARYACLLDDGRRRVAGVGEHLDLDRFRRRGVQFLLRFKMRRANWPGGDG